MTQGLGIVSASCFISTEIPQHNFNQARINLFHVSTIWMPIFLLMSKNKRLSKPKITKVMVLPA
jgi:hypothetical protein